MKKYVIESDWGIGFSINDLADSNEEAAIKLDKLKRNAPLDGMIFRIVPEEVPDGPNERFSFVVRRLIAENCSIDDEDPCNFAIHISWGDWKHEHMRADYVMGLYGFMSYESLVDDEDGSDCYSAWRTYTIKQN